MQGQVQVQEHRGILEILEKAGRLPTRLTAPAGLRGWCWGSAANSGQLLYSARFLKGRLSLIRD